MICFPLRVHFWWLLPVRWMGLTGWPLCIDQQGQEKKSTNHQNSCFTLRANTNSYHTRALHAWMFVHIGYPAIAFSIFGTFLFDRLFTTVVYACVYACDDAAIGDDVVSHSHSKITTTSRIVLFCFRFFFKYHPHFFLLPEYSVCSNRFPPCLLFQMPIIVL